MFLLPPKGDVHWVYDDPSGVPETRSPAQPAKPVSGKVIRFPFRAPATSKAA